MKSRRGPGPLAIGVSLVIHGIVLVPLVAFARPPQAIEFETIRINLVSPPPAEVVQPRPQPPRPQPQPRRETPTPEARPQEQQPEPARPTEQRVERPRTEPPRESSPRTEPPRDTDAAGGDNLNVRTEGRDFPYPDYINNVLIQVNRYFRWTDDSRPKGVVYFEILPDGSVRNIRMYRSSGNIRFDFAVQGAVETAGNRGAFGPLPDGFVAPFLPVNIEVEPPR